MQEENETKKIIADRRPVAQDTPARQYNAPIQTVKMWAESGRVNVLR